MIASDAPPLLRVLVSVLLCGIACGASAEPLQWEKIQSTGYGPAARHSHALATFNSALDMVYIYGGFGGASPWSCGSTCSFFDDVWVFEPSSLGWEQVSFSTGNSTCGASTGVSSQSPAGRAEPAMASCGGSALMCGGYGSDGQGGVAFLEDSRGAIECWWLTPTPLARWDALVYAGSPKSSVLPGPRMGHSIIFDADTKAVILFGGVGGDVGSSTLLNDCWWLNISAYANSTSSTDPLYPGAYTWAPCTLISKVRL